MNYNGTNDKTGCYDEMFQQTDAVHIKTVNICMETLFNLN